MRPRLALVTVSETRPEFSCPAGVQRRCGEYWIAIVPGAAEHRDRSELGRTTAAFPQAFVRAAARADFLNAYGSNHIHMVSGDYTEELVAYCRQTGIPWRVWA